MHSITLTFQFKMFESLDCLRFGSNNSNTTNIINPIDLTTIKNKVTSNAYDCFEEYLIDIEWIYHNCFVYFSGDEKRLF